MRKVTENKTNRLQWMRNIDILTKSKADAEEECKANQQGAEGLSSTETNVSAS
jgi:hypothetical protein